MVQRSHRLGTSRTECGGPSLDTGIAGGRNLAVRHTARITDESASAIQADEETCQGGLDPGEEVEDRSPHQVDDDDRHSAGLGVLSEAESGDPDTDPRGRAGIDSDTEA